jgi:hypothetical protein
VFEDSLRQTWIYFCYRFLASLVNSLTLSTQYVSCHSYYSGDFRVLCDFVFADDFWSVVTQFSLTIPCVNDDSRFSFDFARQQWIRMRCRFHPSAVSHFQRWFLVLQWLSFAVDFWISTGIVCLTIPCVKHEYIFSIGFSPRSWMLWRCRPHTSAATHITWRSQGLRWLYFRWRFLVSVDAVFTGDSMGQRWPCFVFWFRSSTVN